MAETSGPHDEAADEGHSTPIPGINRLSLSDPFRWLQLGWQDMRRAPVPSLAYGLFLVVFSYVVTYLVLNTGDYILLFSLVTGFVLLGPALAFGLYEISRQLQEGRTPRIGHCLRECGRNLGNELVFALVLVVILLVWARAASMVHVFFPAYGEPTLEELVSFLTVGSLVGAVFATLVFSVSAFSLPMMMDRDADVITTILTSMRAVFSNKGPMLVWALIIVLCVVVGVATAYLGFLVLLPLIGHATWHGYQATIQKDSPAGGG